MSEAGSLTEPGASLAGQHILVALPELGDYRCAVVPSSFMWVLGAQTHILMQGGTLGTKPSPQPASFDCLSGVVVYGPSP